MKVSYLKNIAAILLCWMTMGANAQEQPKLVLGGQLGWDYTTIGRTSMGRLDETYAPISGYSVGFQVRYSLLDWLAIRTDFELMNRSYTMERNLPSIDPVRTKYHNDYFMLPVMADFSFGGKRLRGHAYGGVYGAFWKSARTMGTTFWMTDYHIYYEEFEEKRQFNSEDRRLIGGGVTGLGLSYIFPNKDGSRGGNIFFLDALYYYDFNSHHKGHSNLSDPRYLSTLSVTFGYGIYF